MTDPLNWVWDAYFPVHTVPLVSDTAFDTSLAQIQRVLCMGAVW